MCKSPYSRVNKQDTHILNIYFFIIRYHVLCIYDLYVLSYGKQIASVVAVRMSSIVLKALQNCILNTYLLQVMQPILTYSWKISCSYCHDFKCFVIWRVLGLKNPGYLYHHKNMKYDMYWGIAVLYFSMKYHFQLWMALDTEEKLSDLRWSPLTSPSIK